MGNLSKMDNYTKQLIKDALAEIGRIEEKIHSKRLAYLRGLLSSDMLTTDYEGEIIRLTYRKQKIRDMVHEIMGEVRKPT